MILSSGNHDLAIQRMCALTAAWENEIRVILLPRLAPSLAVAVAAENMIFFFLTHLFLAASISLQVDYKVQPCRV